MTHKLAVLFDLDGTLLDTAPDLAHTFNCLRESYGLPPLSLAELKPLISLGAKGMIHETLHMEESDPRFLKLREQFFDLYLIHLSRSTQLFPEMEKVLVFLEKNKIPWGIVTNKLTRHTLPLLKALKLDHRPGCVVCGDTLSTYKPDPQPIIHACQLLNSTPQQCIYVGDSIVDTQASKAAGVKSLVALYGYISNDEDPFSWQADGYIKNPLEIIDWLA